MFVLLPTCNTHAAIAAISAAMLDRYWPGHPTLHVLHYQVKPKIERAKQHDCGRQEQSSWLSTVAGFLRTRTDEMFILLLDDYAMCGPARTGSIDTGVDLMHRDQSVGMFPLCWYPAASRQPRAGYANIVTLRPAPVLIQAAVWRRMWFLELADRIDPRAAAWGFEAFATQAAKQIPRDICAADIPDPAWLGGRLVDGFDKRDWPLPYHNLMHRGQPEVQYEPFLAREGFAFPSRGLGDTIAKVVRATGIERIIHSVKEGDCGCQGRRERLNRAVPYRT